MESGVDLLALFAEVEAEVAAHPERFERPEPAPPHSEKAHEVCRRCHGARRFEEFRHVQGGICFGCDGTGIDGYGRMEKGAL
jgi:hypothetical protein